MQSDTTRHRQLNNRPMSSHTPSTRTPPHLATVVSATSIHRQRPLGQQRGITLITVMVMLLLAGLMVMGASRVSLLNERIIGNSMDYQRAFEAAEATLKDAALDLACMSAGCNNRAGVTTPACDAQEVSNFQATVSALDPPCVNGLCGDLGALANGSPTTSFWSPDPAVNRLAAFNAVGATFGQYTNAAPVAGTAINPTLLANQARYWIEVLPYGASAGGGRSVGSEQAIAGGTPLKPSNNCPFVFRVTSVATGLKPNTTAVVQSLYMFRE